MAEHAWILERLASYTAGGLEAAERGRFEDHVAGCADCAFALDEVKLLDHNLETLFADARPSPGLEDRMIEELRRTPRRLPVLQSPYVRGLMGAAAVLTFGVVGAGATFVAEGGLNSLSALGPRHANSAFGTVGASIGATVSGGMPAVDGERWNEATRTATGMANDAMRRLKEDGLGWATNNAPGDVDTRTNYDMDRVEETAVPGPIDGRQPVGLLGPGGSRRDDKAVIGVIQPSKPEPRPAAVTPAAGMPAPPATVPPPAGFGAMPGKDGHWMYAQDEQLKRAEGKESAGKSGKAADPYYSFRNDDPKRTQPGEKLGAQELEKKLTEGKGEPKGPPPAAPVAPTPAPAPPTDNAPKPEAKTPTPAPPAAEEVPVAARKIIRSGEIEFEIDSFEHSVERVTKVAGEERGFIATVNSEKLPNGKVRGTIVVRCPPDRLDTLLLKLRALGDLKSQRIGSQDVTKMYTDIESELRGARAMENRLIEIIKSGKGEIKDLLVAEKELGTWRTKIEKMEGEIRYYNNLISLSTLSITLTEKEIRAAFGVTETEKVEMGIEVEDVEKGQQEAHTLISDTKGRILKSELKQSPNGQYQALISFEAAPDAAGPLRDRLKQLGVVSRLEIGRLQQVEGGSTRPVNAKTERSDTQFHLSLYNIASVMPRETVHLTVVCHDTESAYQTVVNKLNKLAGARILSSPLERGRGDQVSATVNFEVKNADADGLLNDLRGLGEVMKHQVTEQPEGNNVTKSKRGFNVALWAVAAVKPRETNFVTIATREVPESFKALQDAVNGAKARVLHAQLDEHDRSNVAGTIDFEVRRGDEAGILKALGGAGEVLTRQVGRAQENEGVIDSKVRYQFKIVSLANGTKPRETVQLVMASKDVPAAYRALQEEVGKCKGWVTHARLNEADRRHINAKLTFEVRRSEEAALLKALGATGDVQKRDVVRAADAADVIDTKVRYDLDLLNVANIPPRETVKLGVEVKDVDAAAAVLLKLVAEVKGRSEGLNVIQLPNGTTSAKLICDVPLASADVLKAKFKSVGVVRNQQNTLNESVPDSALAVARFDVLLSNEAPILAADAGPWESMKKGLSYSMIAIGYSLMWVVVGLMVVLPWGLAAWIFMKLVARFRGKADAPAATAS